MLVRGSWEGPGSVSCLLYLIITAQRLFIFTRWQRGLEINSDHSADPTHLHIFCSEPAQPGQPQSAGLAGRPGWLPSGKVSAKSPSNKSGPVQKSKGGDGWGSPAFSNWRERGEAEGHDFDIYQNHERSVDGGGWEK